jgi:hypothetical protein
MDILEFTDDLEKKTKGVKVFLNREKSAYIVVAAWGTAAFWESFRKHKEAICADADNGTEKELSRALASAVADTVLLGWEGITDEGKDIKYSKEKAIEWLSDPAKERFFEKVRDEAVKAENFKAQRLQKEKNS